MSKLFNIVKDQVSKQIITRGKDNIKAVANQTNNIIQTTREATRVVKWSVLLLSTGLFLFGTAKVIEAIRPIIIKKD